MSRIKVSAVWMLVLLLVIAYAMVGCSQARFITHTASANDGARLYVCYYDPNTKGSYVKLCTLMSDNGYQCVQQTEFEKIVNR